MSWRQSGEGALPSFRLFPSSSSSPISAGQGNLQRPQDSCSYTRSIVSRCFTEQNTDGKPVKKCEKTEQLLRNCIGRYALSPSVLEFNLVYLFDIFCFAFQMSCKHCPLILCYICSFFSVQY